MPWNPSGWTSSLHARSDPALGIMQNRGGASCNTYNEPDSNSGHAVLTHAVPSGRERLAGRQNSGK